MPTTEPAPVQNFADVPLYTPLDAAQYLHLPVWCVLAISEPGRFYPEEFFFDRHWLRWEVTDSEPNRFPRLCFQRLADLFVRSAVVRGLRETLEESAPARRLHPEEVWSAVGIRPSAGILLDPLAVDELVRRAVDRVPSLNADRLRKLLLLHLDRVELVDGVPVRLFPFSRDPAAGAPRLVVLNPRVRFGRPTLAGRGVPTDIVIERFRGGDSAAFMAEDYDTPVEEIEEAIRYETRTTIGFPLPFIGW